MQIFFIVLLSYLLIRFIMGFVLPVFNTASRMKRQFKEMNRQQSAFQNHQDDKTTVNSAPDSRPANESRRTTSGKKAPKEDYLDFEEVPSGKV